MEFTHRFAPEKNNNGCAQLLKSKLPVVFYRDMHVIRKASLILRQSFGILFVIPMHETGHWTDYTKAKSTPTCWHFKSTRKGHWPWQLFSKGLQPSPKFPPVTLYPTHNCVIHSKDTISQPPFSTSPTKYRRCKFLDSSTVA
jgi:hypothetical protein